MERVPLAGQLLRDVETAHRALSERGMASEAQRGGLHAVYAAIEAGLSEIDEAALNRSCSPEEWSMAEVVEHVAEHDRKYAELAAQGMDHYVEHGLEHAMQLWRLRAQSSR